MAATEAVEEKKRAKAAPRTYPQLTLRQEKEVASALESDVSELAKAREELAKLKAHAVICPMSDPETFKKYHPEKLELLKDPDAITDPPSPPPQDGSFHLPPRSNRNKYYDAFHAWTNEEMKTTPEWRRYSGWIRKTGKIEGHIRRLEKDEELRQAAKTLHAQWPGIEVSVKGAEFVKTCVKYAKEDTPSGKKRKKTLGTYVKASAEVAEKVKARKREVTSLYVPIAYADHPGVKNPSTSSKAAMDVVKYRIRRDETGEYSESQDALVFYAEGEACGVIYAESEPPTFWPVVKLGYANQRARLDAHVALLAAAVRDIFAAIGAGPEAFFADAGKRCGMCMFCGHDLSDEESKIRGFGAICEKRVFG